MSATTLTNPLNVLPLGDRDRAYLDKTLDMLWDEPVSDYDFQDVVAHTYGLNVYRQWEGARSIPVILFADRRPAMKLEEFMWGELIPSRQQVLDALEAAAARWKEELE